jgi:hypothetical protein
MARPAALRAAGGIACLGASLITSNIFAQGVQTGIIRGRVLDPHDLPVPNVTVRVASPALQVGHSVLTGPDGAYVFRSLPPGSYEIAYVLAAFAPAVRSISLPLGGAIEQNLTLAPAQVVETVEVVGESSTPLDSPIVGLDIKKGVVDALATSRALEGLGTLSPGVTDNAPNAGQLVINGAFAFDNMFMVNGVDVTDNIFGAPQNLFIEDAIEDTAVLTSGIGAEYGRFSGGVVNAVTKSGGNTFSGSYRLNVSNPSWSSTTPFDRTAGTISRSSLDLGHEATFGGPLVKNRLWFFGAARLAAVDSSRTLNQTGLPFTETAKDRRGEIKVTGTVGSAHTFHAGYVGDHHEVVNGPSFPFSIDPFTLDHQTEPNWHAFVNYRGVVSQRLLVEAQFSERRFRFAGAGGTSLAIADSPFITLFQSPGQYNAPFFDATDPESRNNRQLAGGLTYVLDRAGRHELKAGYEWFRSQHVGGGSQSSTGYVFDADYATDASGRPQMDSAGHLVPIFAPGGTILEHWIAERAAQLNVNTHSFYAQDYWTLGRRVSADLGFRFEHVRSHATGGMAGVDTSTIVPRLAVAYDPGGDGRFVLHTTYGEYAGRYDEAQIGVNSSVGNPARTIAFYLGPPGQGRSFAPGFDPRNYLIFTGVFPTANVQVDRNLSAPITKEVTFSAGTTIGARGYGEASYIWRRTEHVIEDFISVSNGTTKVERDGVDFGSFTNIVYRNSDIPQRRYQGVVLQGRYQARTNWSLAAFWTIQLKNDGNYEGEAANQPGVSSSIGNFPEGFDPARNEPLGHLQSFERHRVRLWSIVNVDARRFGSFSLSGLMRIESGRAYSLVATNQRLTDIQTTLLAGYPDAPFGQRVYFGARGSQAFPGYAALDASMTYNLPAIRTLRPWLKIDIFNLFNNQKLIGFNTTVAQDPNSPTDSLGLATGFTKGPTFGQAETDADFPQPRTLRVAVGVRF